MRNSFCKALSSLLKPQGALCAVGVINLRADSNRRVRFDVGGSGYLRSGADYGEHVILFVLEEGDPHAFKVGSMPVQVVL